MPRKSTLDESALTKDEIRKLSAFRESVGEEAGNRMFLEWLLKKTAIAFKPKLKDENAAMIADALAPLIEQNRLRIPRGGYLILQARGRMIVVRPELR